MEDAFGVRANAVRVNYYRNNKAGDASPGARVVFSGFGDEFGENSWVYGTTGEWGFEYDFLREPTNLYQWINESMNECDSANQ